MIKVKRENSNSQRIWNSAEFLNNNLRKLVLGKSQGSGKWEKIQQHLYPNVEYVLFHWYTTARAQNWPTSGPILKKKKKKASNLGLALRFEDGMAHILDKYALSDIYNAGESRLFYQMLPSNIMEIISEKFEGGKASKKTCWTKAALDPRPPGYNNIQNNKRIQKTKFGWVLAQFLTRMQ